MNRAIDQYQKVMLNTSSPLENIILLYEKCLRHLKQAHNSIELGEAAERQTALSKAIDIIMALDNALDLNAGEIAHNLHNIYLSMIFQLALANSKNQIEPLAAVQKLLAELLDGWKQISGEK